MADNLAPAKATIGVNVVVVREGKVLLGKRKGIAGDGYWGLPGGRLDKGEWVLEAAKRELAEETGLVAQGMQFIKAMHQLQSGSHWVQFGFVVTKYKGEVVNREPDVCGGWEWFDESDLPEKVFPPHRQLIRAWFKKADMFGEEIIEL